jgi:hypothetical protein
MHMEGYFNSCTDFKHPFQSLLALPASYSLCCFISLILPQRQHHFNSEKRSYKIIPLLILVKYVLLFNCLLSRERLYRVVRRMHRQTPSPHTRPAVYSLPRERVMGPTQHPQCLPGVKRLGCQADHFPQISADVKNKWIYASTPPWSDA